MASTMNDSSILRYVKQLRRAGFNDRQIATVIRVMDENTTEVQGEIQAKAFMMFAGVACNVLDTDDDYGPLFHDKMAAFLNECFMLYSECCEKLLTWEEICDYNRSALGLDINLSDLKVVGKSADDCIKYEGKNWEDTYSIKRKLGE